MAQTSTQHLRRSSHPAVQNTIHHMATSVAEQHVGQAANRHGNAGDKDADTFQKRIASPSNSIRDLEGTRATEQPVGADAIN